MRYFVQPEYDPVIFCEEVRAEPDDDGDREVDNAGYLWCRCYSTRCVDGEMGHVHPDTAIELSHDELKRLDAQPMLSEWTVGIPGTGIYYTSHSGYHSGAHSAHVDGSITDSQQDTAHGVAQMIMVICIVGAVALAIALVGSLAGGGKP